MLDMNKIGLFNYLNQEERKKEINKRIIDLRRAINNSGGASNFVKNCRHQGLDIQIDFSFPLTKEEETYFKSYFKDLEEETCFKSYFKDLDEAL